MDPGGMRFCTTCGSQRTGTHSFCTVCGAEFRDLVRPGPPAAAAEPVAVRPRRIRTRIILTSLSWSLARSPETRCPPKRSCPRGRAALRSSRPIWDLLLCEPSAGGPGQSRRWQLSGIDCLSQAHQSAAGKAEQDHPHGRGGRCVVLGAAGSAYALVADHGHGKASGEQKQAASVAASPAARHPAPTSAVPTSAPVSPTASSGTTVAVAPGVAGNRAAPRVTMLLNRYFTAINKHDYSAWVSLFDQQTAAAGSRVVI